MKAIFKKEILSLCINHSLGCISTEKTYDIIAGILINTISADKCQISAFDTEKGIKTIIDAEVLEEGSIVINGNKLASMVRLLSDEITIETHDGIAIISSGKSQFQLHYKDGDNFPNMPEFSPDRSFTLPQKLLKELVGQTSFAISKDNDRPNLTGLYFDVFGDKLKVVACDSYRLAIRNKKIDTDLQTKGEEELKFIVPGKTIVELEKIIDESDEKIKFSLTKKHIIFSFNIKYGNEYKETILFSRLVEGNFVEYNRFIPKDCVTFVYIERSLLEDSLTKASLITEDKTQGQAKSIVKFEIKDDVLKTSAVSVNGKIYDEIAIQKQGNDLEIGFSCKYLLEILRSTNADNLKLSLVSSLMSMKIEDGDTNDLDNSFLYLALPMKMKDQRE